MTCLSSWSEVLSYALKYRLGWRKIKISGRFDRSEESEGNSYS